MRLEPPHPPVVLELLEDVNSCSGLLPAGTRGRLAAPAGTSMYAMHVELPFNGTGVPHAALGVVVEGQALSLKDWAARTGRTIRCGRCRTDLISGEPHPRPLAADSVARRPRLWAGVSPVGSRPRRNCQFGCQGRGGGGGAACQGGAGGPHGEVRGGVCQGEANQPWGGCGGSGYWGSPQFPGGQTVGGCLRGRGGWLRAMGGRGE